jgi:hypothetical protein
VTIFGLSAAFKTLFTHRPFTFAILFVFKHSTTSIIAIMSWRSQGITGSNNIPLGNRRRFGGDESSAQDGGYVPSPSSDGMADSSYKRGRSPARGEASPLSKIQSSH